MNRFSRTLVGASFLVTLVFPGPADAKVTRTGDATVQFTATATGGLAIVGTTSDLTVADDGTNVRITVALGGITTGIGLRDRHTKKLLEVDRYPTAELVMPRAQLQFGSAGEVVGNLTIHGVTKPAKIRYDASKQGNGHVLHGTTRINVNEFGMQPPSYFKVTVDPNVDLDVKFPGADS